MISFSSTRKPKLDVGNEADLGASSSVTQVQPLVLPPSHS